MTLDGGKAVRFIYPCGATYDVPILYLVQWFDTLPRHISKVRTTRVIFNRKLTRVYFNNGKSMDVAWDTVLMACEPEYEHFGGLTAESQKQTRAAMVRYGRFRYEKGEPGNELS